MSCPETEPEDGAALELELERYLAAARTDEETAHRAVAPYRTMVPAERWSAFCDLLREMDALLGGREPFRDEADRAFWRHWMDPLLGRPR